MNPGSLAAEDILNYWEADEGLGSHVAPSGSFGGACLSPRVPFPGPRLNSTPSPGFPGMWSVDPRKLVLHFRLDTPNRPQVKKGRSTCVPRERSYWVACLLPTSALVVTVGHRSPCRSSLSPSSAPPPLSVSPMFPESRAGLRKD